MQAYQFRPRIVPAVQVRTAGHFNAGDYLVLDGGSVDVWDREAFERTLVAVELPPPAPPNPFADERVRELYKAAWSLVTLLMVSDPLSAEWQGAKTLQDALEVCRPLYDDVPLTQDQSS